MPISGEQPDLNALPPESSPVNRRLATQHVREARDRLTSSGETKPAFEYELLRQYAQNRISASLVILLLVATVGFMSSVWSGALAAGTWTVAVLVTHAVIVTKCRQFLEKPANEISIRAWRLRFITLDLFYGLAWMFILVHPVSVDDNSGTFMLFVILLVVAVSSMLASSLPMAVFAATFPVTTAIALDFVLQGRLRDYILSVMALTAQGYFAALTYQLYSSTLATLQARAEKDALIGELEQAKAISDEARRRAEAANIAKSRFLAQMSHELRTPLASILGAATVLSAAPALRQEKKLTALVHDVRDEAERLNNDIQNLLDATRISSDGIKPHVEWADPGDIINSAVERCRHRLADRRIVIDVPPDLPLIHVDPILIQQALVQIFDNAVKYSESGSQIKVAVRTQDGRLNINVTDNGAGLTTTEAAKIWDRFARGERHAATTSGSGLGLWIASAFIGANDGKVSATSEGPGLGTTLSIELPVSQDALPQLESGADE